MVGFKLFVKSMTSCLSKLKATNKFCFSNAIPDNVTTTSTWPYFSLFSALDELLGKNHWNYCFRLASYWPGRDNSKKFQSKNSNKIEERGFLCFLRRNQNWSISIWVIYSWCGWLGQNFIWYGVWGGISRIYENYFNWGNMQVLLFGHIFLRHFKITKWSFICCCVDFFQFVFISLRLTV